jgi:hypothetical protein
MGPAAITPLHVHGMTTLWNRKISRKFVKIYYCSIAKSIIIIALSIVEKGSNGTRL